MRLRGSTAAALVRRTATAPRSHRSNRRTVAAGRWALALRTLVQAPGRSRLHGVCHESGYFQCQLIQCQPQARISTSPQTFSRCK